MDAELLAAHVVGVPRGRLMMVPLVDPPVLEEYRALVARRAAREPLQHLLGTAVLGPVAVAVGPGVFTPRPETELLLEWGLKAIAGVASPLVVDLCTGSGALALAVAASRPDAVVHAVEADPAALSWARRNVAAHVDAGGTPVALHAADVRWPDLLPELESHGATSCCATRRTCRTARRCRRRWREWDPPGAVFGGPDGLEIIRAVVTASAALLRHGGRLAIEHDDTHGEVGPGAAAAAPGAHRRRGAPRPGRAAPASPPPGGRAVAYALARRLTDARAPLVTLYDCADPDARLAGLAAAALAVRARAAGRAAHRHPLRPGRRRLLAQRRPLAAGGEGARAGHARARARRLLEHDRRPGHDACPAAARELVEAFWPGGLSLVLPHAPSLTWDLGVTRGTVMLRMPLHPVALELLRDVGPMAVSSANISGRPPATTAAEAVDQLGAAAAVYLDGGPCRVGVASTIVDLTGDEPRILREGAVGAPQIAEVLGREVATPDRVPWHVVDEQTFWGPDFDALQQQDPEIAGVVLDELERLRGGLQLIASENLTSPAVLAALGSTLSNKYAEGYPGRRYYGGCQVVDVAEEIGNARAKELFGAEHANLQPHSGASANLAATPRSPSPATRCWRWTSSRAATSRTAARSTSPGKWFNAVSYTVREDDELIDYDQVRDLAREHRPKMIIAGATAYPRLIDFKAFREIADEVGAKLMVDAAHFIGLVAGKAIPSPVPYADVVTATTHKVLRGPRGGMMLCREEHAKAIDKAVFPFSQGGPLMHAVAAKAVAMQGGGAAGVPGATPRR